MKFEDLDLMCAIYDERIEMEENGEQPGAEHWIKTEEGQLNLCRRINNRLMRSPDLRIIDAWLKFRKCGRKNIDGPDASQKRLELIVEVARLRGRVCFYACCNKGECSDELDLDRIKTGSRGGEYTVQNCIISCSRHNRMRGDTPFEEFINS